MTTRLLLVLVAAAILISTVALMLNRPSPPVSGATAVPASLFPNLTAQVNNVATIEIRRPGDTLTIARNADQWVVASKGGYPANIEQVKSTILALAQLKPLEAKTSNPELYPRVGVQDPSAAHASPESADPQASPVIPTHVTLKDAQGATLASLIVGSQKWGTTPSVFVRKPDEPQSWLAEAGDAGLHVPTDAMDWVDRQVLNIPRDRIKSVSVVHPADGSEVEVSRENNTDASFTFTSIPEGRELTAPTAPETLVTGIQFLNIDDFAPIAQISFTSPEAIAVYRTFDGLVITIQSVTKDEKHWINASFSVSEPQTDSDESSAATVHKEADELTATLAQWAFAIPQYKAKTFTSRLDDFLKPLPAAAPSEPHTDTEIGPQPLPVGPEPDSDP